MGSSRNWNKVTKENSSPPQPIHILSNKKLFAFSLQQFKDEVDAFKEVKDYLKSGYLVHIERLYVNGYPMFFSYIDYKIEEDGSFLIPPNSYIYEVVEDKAVYLDSDKKDRS